MRPAVTQRMLVLRPPILHSWLSAVAPSCPRASPLQTDPWYFGSCFLFFRHKKSPGGKTSGKACTLLACLPLRIHPNGYACGSEAASGPAHRRAGGERRGERHRLSHARLGKLGSMPPPLEQRRVAQGQSLHPMRQRKSARCIPLCSAAWLSGWLATQTGNCLCKRWRTAVYCACRRCRVSCALRTVKAATPCSCSRGARALVGKSTSASCAARALLEHARENAAAADTVGSVRTGS